MRANSRKRLFYGTFLTQDQADEVFIVKVTRTPVIIQLRYLETAFTQLTDIERKPVTLAVEYLGCCTGLTDKYEGFILRQITVVLLADDTLKTAKLLTHVNRLHAQEVVQVGM